MNYIKHLSGFFDKVSKDDRLNPTHISLYVSLFQFWNACRFHNPISISRNEAMKVSKINSKATYHKCMRELNDFGYLNYQPSYNPFKGSLVYLFNFQAGVNKVDNQPKSETSSEPELNGKRTIIETSNEQALVPYTNNINNTKQQTRVNSHTLKKNYEKNSKNSEVDSPKYADGTSGRNSGRLSCEGKKSSGADAAASEESGALPQRTESGFQRPLREEIHAYFESKHWPKKEADKFYNHYESNGWLVGGKSPMQNWQASARKWMANSQSEQFNLSSSTGRSGKTLNVSGSKDYSEPL